MADNLNLGYNGITLNKKYANIDGQWGPYESVSNALSTIRGTQKVVGKRFGVKTASGEVREYVLLKRTENGQDVWYTAPVSSLSDKDAEFEEIVEVEGSEEEVTPALLSKGYKTLIKGIPLGEQLTKENTIYEVRDNFDLGGKVGETHTVALNDTLVYNGKRYYYNSNSFTFDDYQIVKKESGVEFWNSGEDTPMSGIGSNYLPYTMAKSFRLFKSVATANTNYHTERQLTVGVNKRSTIDGIVNIGTNVYHILPINVETDNVIKLPVSNELVIIKGNPTIGYGLDNNISADGTYNKYVVQESGIIYIGHIKVSSDTWLFSFLYIVNKKDANVPIAVNSENTVTLNNATYYYSNDNISIDFQNSFDDLFIDDYGIAEECLPITANGETYIKLFVNNGFGLSNSSRTEKLTLESNAYTMNDPNDTFSFRVIQEAPSAINTNYEVWNCAVIPTGCALRFNGGKISNGIIEGNHATIIDNPTHNIFDDCEVLNFNFGFVDVRWFGAISDAVLVDSYTCNGTDNAVYFERAINACHNNPGASVKVIGKYRIASTIETQHDLNLHGEYHINRNPSTVLEYPPSNNFNSMIYVDKCTAFSLLGRGDAKHKIAFIDVSNIFFRAVPTSASSNNTTIIESLANGSPTRTGKFKDCECKGFDAAIKIQENPNFVTVEGTTYGCLVIDGCVSYGGRQFLYCDAPKINGKQHKSIDNLVIRSCNIEQMSGTAIEIWDAVSGISIIDNIIEGVPHAIYLGRCSPATISIERNYFEAITKDAVKGDYAIYVQGVNLDTRVNIFQNTIMTNGNPNYIKDVIIEGPIVIDSIDSMFTLHTKGLVQIPSSDLRQISSLSMKNMDGMIITRALFYHDLFDAYNKVDDICHLSAGITGRMRYIWNDIYGFKTTAGKNGWNGVFSITKPYNDNTTFKEGDIVYVCFYCHQSTDNFIANLYYIVPNSDPVQTIACAEQKGIYRFKGCAVICSFVLNSNAQGKDRLVLYICPSLTIDGAETIVGDGTYYVKDADDTSSSKSIMYLGIVQGLIRNPLDASIRPELMPNRFISAIGNRKGIYYSDGEFVKNIDGTLPSRVKIVSSYYDGVFSDTNTIYKIVGNINIGSATINVGKGCVFDFTGGGTITTDYVEESKAKLVLLLTRIVIPEGASIRSYIDSHIIINGSFASNQCIYDNLTFKPIWYRYNNKVQAITTRVDNNDVVVNTDSNHQYTDANGTPVGYSVQFYLTNVQCDNLIFYALVGQTYTMHFTAVNGKTLSQAPSIKINGTDADTNDYTWSIQDNVGTLTFTPSIHGYITMTLNLR